jgi:hypothetical protein
VPKGGKTERRESVTALNVRCNPFEKQTPPFFPQRPSHDILTQSGTFIATERLLDEGDVVLGLKADLIVVVAIKNLRLALFGRAALLVSRIGILPEVIRFYRKHDEGLRREIGGAKIEAGVT